jgi:mucin-19
VSTNGAANGILLDTLGTSVVTANGGTIGNATTRGVDINSGRGNFSYAGTISTTATGRSVEVTNRTGGTVTFSGAVSDNGLGINLETSTSRTTALR